MLFKKLFEKSRDVGVGIEINFDLSKYDECDKERVLRPYRIAKKAGCKFYLGSDVHRVKGLIDYHPMFTTIIDALCLEESDKFIIKKDR